MKNVTIVTDGSCLNNGQDGAYGGWAAILKYGTHRREICGNSKGTTNNRMELTAVIEAAKMLTLPCEITIVTDSQYVCHVLDGMSKWAQNNWHSSGSNYPKNLEMIQNLWQVISSGKHTIKFQKVKGHSGDPDNERADTLAQTEAKSLKFLEGING